MSIAGSSQRLDRAVLGGTDMQTTRSHLGVLYEHPEWFRPLFAELDRRALPYHAIHADDLNFDPADRSSPYALILNRMSPSAYLRGHGHAIFAAQAFLRHAEIMGTRVVNGSEAFGLELSKTAQIALLSRLGLPHPRTRVINTAAARSEEHTSELQSPTNLVCRLLLEKKKK